jgi:uncharacterized protein with WD repeat
MSHPSPCIAWAEQLALRQEDLTPTGRAALAAHVATCPACQAAQTDYQFLDARLRALPPPTMQPFPRLSSLLPLPEQREHARRGEAPQQAQEPRAPAAHAIAPTRRARPGHPVLVFLKKTVFNTFVAALVLVFVLVLGARSSTTGGPHLPGTALLTYTGHSDFVSALAWSPDGRYLASGSWDHTVQVWDAKTGSQLFSYRHGDIVDALAWSPDGRYLASGSWDHTVEVWDMQSFSLVTIYTGHSDFVSTLAWSPDGRYLASGSWDHTVQVWDAHTKSLLFSYQYGEIVDSVAWSPNGLFLAVGGRDGTVHVLDAQTGTRRLIYFGHTGSPTSVINAVAWSPDSRLIASGDRDHRVLVWEAATGKLVTTFTGHTAEVYVLAWSPDGRYLASGSVDHTVQVWQATTGLPLLTYRGHHQNVDALAWSPNGHLIASGSWDHTVQIWQAIYDA